MGGIETKLTQNGTLSRIRPNILSIPQRLSESQPEASRGRTTAINSISGELTNGRDSFPFVHCSFLEHHWPSLMGVMLCSYVRFWRALNHMKCVVLGTNKWSDFFPSVQGRGLGLRSNPKARPLVLIGAVFIRIIIHLFKLTCSYTRLYSLYRVNV